tara:strand:- start:107122 stop:107511 length:390 start_codon:yes stop_codon:yes gene_type:complete
MRKALLALAAVLLLASFASDTTNKTILKDIDGTLLQSYVVIDKTNHTVTFDVDANTTVSSSIIDGEFKVFLVENGNSGNNISHTLEVGNSNAISFDHYFEGSYDVASNGEMMINDPIKVVRKRPITVEE